MFAESQLAKIFAFAQRVEAVNKQCHEVHRSLSALISERAGMDLLLAGPAEDSGAKLSDADILLADLQGKLRELQLGVSALLNAQGLPEQVHALGWTFAGWDSELGWISWRIWEIGAVGETVTDRNAAALLYKLQLRNMAEARHV
jgi:hypothetical protein